MKTSFLEPSALQTPSVQLARLSGPHGYRFEDDTVHLNAMFALLHPAAHDCSWALQLWACPTAPTSARDLAGHIVSEVSLPPMSELADEIEHFDMSVPAWTTAGTGEYTMVLALVSGTPGQFTDVHDLDVYPERQQFLQPRLSGNVGYRLDGGRVQISVERVENPRTVENRSGTLSLELWALSAPFDGGRFQGHHLAGVEIGTLNGQNELALQPIELSFAQPAAGEWQIALMLREWANGGFVTRDFANFAIPFLSAPIVEKALAPVVEKPVASVVDKPSVPVVEKPAAPVVAKASIAPVTNGVVAAVEKPVAPVIAKAAVPVVEKPAAPIAAKAPAVAVAKAAIPALPPKAVANASVKGVSVNTARLEELAAVEGLSAKLAEGIVKHRPFKSLDELSRVKGLGAKLLAKIRAGLKL